LTAGHIIPSKGLQTFDKVLMDTDPKVQINLEDRQVMIRSGPAEVSSRLVEGAFPRYDSVIPRETILTTDFSKAELLSALRQTAILTNEESRSVRLAFSADKLVITSRAMDVGEARVEIETTCEGDPIDVAFNPDFLVEGIRIMEGERVKFSVSGKDTPARLDGEEDFIYVVMPVTLRTG
jgi:DNA polymerase-3 subunit beta